jgi:hypothetical protein
MQAERRDNPIDGVGTGTRQRSHGRKVRNEAPEHRGYLRSACSPEHQLRDQDCVGTTFCVSPRQPTWVGP